jgi:hypothetical protein
MIAAASVGVVIVAFSLALREESAAISGPVSPQAAEVVAAEAARDASLRIFAGETYADWLLWLHPELAGRLAFDVRFELFSKEQFRAVVDVYHRREGWRKHVAGYRLFVLEPERRALAKTLLEEPGAHRVYADSTVVVVGIGR